MRTTRKLTEHAEGQTKIQIYTIQLQLQEWYKIVVYRNDGLFLTPNNFDKYLSGNERDSLITFNPLSRACYKLQYVVCVIVLQVKLLQSLGLKSTLITDGSSPINLFSTAQGLIGALQQPAGSDTDYD